MSISSLTEIHIILFLQLCLIVKQLIEHLTKRCDNCNRRTKMFKCKSGCCEFVQRQRSDPDFDLESPSSEESQELTLGNLSQALAQSPELADAIEKLNARLETNT